MRSCRSASRRQRSSVARASRVVRRHRDAASRRCGPRARGRPCGTESVRAARAPASASDRAQRALELVPRVGIAPLERGGHAGAEVQARVLRIGGQRFAKRLRRGVRLAGVERVSTPPARAARRADRFAHRAYRAPAARAQTAAAGWRVIGTIRIMPSFFTTTSRWRHRRLSFPHGLMLSLHASCHASASLGPDRRRRDRRPQECQPAADRTFARQRSGRRSRVRFAADSRSDRRARRSLRHLDSAERRARDPHGRAGGGAGHRAWSRTGRRPDGRHCGRCPRRWRSGARADAGYCFVTGDGERRRSYAGLQQAALRARRRARARRACAAATWSRSSCPTPSSS